MQPDSKPAVGSGDQPQSALQPHNSANLPSSQHPAKPSPAGHTGPVSGADSNNNHHGSTSGPTPPQPEHQHQQAQQLPTAAAAPSTVTAPAQQTQHSAGGFIQQQAGSAPQKVPNSSIGRQLQQVAAGSVDTAHAFEPLIAPDGELLVPAVEYGTTGASSDLEQQFSPDHLAAAGSSFFDFLEAGVSDHLNGTPEAAVDVSSGVVVANLDTANLDTANLDTAADAEATMSSAYILPVANPAETGTSMPADEAEVGMFEGGSELELLTDSDTANPSAWEAAAAATEAPLGIPATEAAPLDLHTGEPADAVSATSAESSSWQPIPVTEGPLSNAISDSLSPQSAEHDLIATLEASILSNPDAQLDSTAGDRKLQGADAAERLYPVPSCAPHHSSHCQRDPHYYLGSRPGRQQPRRLMQQSLKPAV